MSERSFLWRDGERTIVFGAGTLARAPQALAEHRWNRYVLLSTERALTTAPPLLAERAEAVFSVPAGPVNETADVLFEAVESESLLALGGGRVIDTAKAIAAVRGARVAAIPTTLSGAEMTAIHRLPKGRSARAGQVRPELVLADPMAMVSLPEHGLRASAMNALAHGAEPLYTPYANPVATMATLRGAKLLAQALDQGPQRDPHGLALGALLCAYALDSAGFALHHVISQTLVRTLRIPHAETNATMLPVVLTAMRERAPEAIEALARALGTTPEAIGSRVVELGGGQRSLSGLGADEDRVEAAIEAIVERAELAQTPDPPDAGEIRALIEAAW